jgi:hypothetical protein
MFAVVCANCAHRVLRLEGEIQCISASLPLFSGRLQLILVASTFPFSKNPPPMGNHADVLKAGPWD